MSGFMICTAHKTFGW